MSKLLTLLKYLIKPIKGGLLVLDVLVYARMIS